MKKFYLAFIIGTLLFSVTLFLYSRNSGASPSDSTTDDELSGESYCAYGESDFREILQGNAFETWLRSGLDTSVVPSVVTGIVAGDKLVYSNGVYADTDTKFCIASLTKTFTSILALKLQEDGTFSLDDPVRKYLPGVRIERAELDSEPVTLRHLLSHTSGMPSSGRKYITYAISGKEISLPEQVNPAGYWYAYSNDSYVLMKYVIEAATGRTYADLMREKVFKPLGMKSSLADESNGTGGITTTMKDLAKYASMLIHRGGIRGRKIMSGDSYMQMLDGNVELPATGSDYYYSLGWEVITMDGGIDSYYKAGRWFGGASCVQVFPRRKIAILYLCNPPNHLSEEFMKWRQALTGRLRQMARQASGDETLCTKWPSLSAKELGRYAGVYGNILSGEKIRVSYLNNSLYSDFSGNMVPLRVFTSNRLLPATGNVVHNFVWKEGAVIGLALSSGFYKRVQ